MAYIDTQTRSPAIHLKQMRKQMMEIIENKNNKKHSFAQILWTLNFSKDNCQSQGK